MSVTLKYKCSQRQGSSFIAIMIVLAVAGLIFWLTTRKIENKRAQDTLMNDVGLDTSGYKGMLNGARRVADDASQPRQ